MRTETSVFMDHDHTGKPFLSFRPGIMGAHVARLTRVCDIPHVEARIIRRHEFGQSLIFPDYGHQRDCGRGAAGEDSQSLEKFTTIEVSFDVIIV
jgi:hypothetical protein